MSRKVTLIGLGVVVAAMLASAVWYSQRPARVVDGSLQELAEAKTAAFVATLQLENAAATQQLLGEAGTVTLTLDGGFVRKEQGRDDLQADLAVVTKTDSVSVSLEGELRFVGDQAFVFIEKSPPIFGLLNQLKGQWLQFPRGGVDQEQPVQSDAALFTQVDRQGTKELNGEQVVVYKAVATEAAVVSMMDSIAQLLGTNLTQQQVADIQQSVKGVQNVPVEIAVKRWSNDLKHLSTVLAIPGGNTVHFTLQVKDLNAPVTVAAPDQAIPIDAALQRLTAPTPTR